MPFPAAFADTLSETVTFRIETIGDVRSADIHLLLQAVEDAVSW
jgi:hypothetical protein